VTSRQLEQRRALAPILLFILTATGDSKNKAALKMLLLTSMKKAILNYLEEREEDKISWTGIENGPFFDWYGSRAVSLTLQ
jgi:hypothetical protein